MTPGWLRGCRQQLSLAFDTALIDLDGVVYVGPAPVAHAPAALAAARSRGMRLAYVTNNAARSPQEITIHLRKLGVAAHVDDVITSSLAAAGLLATVIPAGSLVLVVGGPGLHEALRDRGFAVTEYDDPAVAAVVQGYGPHVSWALLAEAALALQRGVPWLATNLDATLPSPRGLLPGNGALVAALAASTGRQPVSVGKPERPLLDEAVRRTGARRPLVVGDRLDTDIESAAKASLDSLLVLTGVTDPRHLLTAPPQRRPAYISADLRGLNETHPAVRVDGSVASCRTNRAAREGNVITLSAVGPSDPMDALRAAVALAWLAPAPTFDVRGDGSLLAALGLPAAG